MQNLRDKQSIFESGLYISVSHGLSLLVPKSLLKEVFLSAIRFSFTIRNSYWICYGGIFPKSRAFRLIVFYYYDYYYHHRHDCSCYSFKILRIFPEIFYQSRCIEMQHHWACVAGFEREQIYTYQMPSQAITINLSAL